MASLQFFFPLLAGVWVLLLLTSPALSLTCNTLKFTNNNLYTHCLDLPQLTSYLHFTYNAANSSLSVAFTAPPAKSTGWICWGLNPTATGMLGTQGLIAFKLSTGAMTVKKYNISGFVLRESEIAFEVWDLGAEEVDGLMRLYAKLKVPEGANGTVNQVWQVGGSVTGGVPDKHEMSEANMKSVGTLDLVAGQSGGTTVGDSRIKKKNIHGILNAVSWGILLPIGAIIARYVRTFESADPAWFYLHASCQLSGYAIGVAGWATGLKLGSESKGVQFTTHRNIGITLFTLATVQIFALFLRPKKDHKFRFYWNIYHHGVGYAILILGIINVFKGLDILLPEEKWKSAYIIVISVLGGIALLLEAVTWIVVLRRKSNKSTKPYDGYNNGEGRQQPLAI